MKRKMLIIILALITIGLLITIGWYIMFAYFGKGPMLPFMKTKKAEPNTAGGFVAEDAPLMALVQTEEETGKIAGQYNIELVSYEDGIALYQTEEDPYTVIARGEENGYPPLSINYVRTIDDINEQRTE